MVCTPTALIPSPAVPSSSLHSPTFRRSTGVRVFFGSGIGPLRNSTRNGKKCLLPDCSWQELGLVDSSPLYLRSYPLGSPLGLSAG